MCEQVKKTADVSLLTDRKKNTVQLDNCRMEASVKIVLVGRRV